MTGWLGGDASDLEVVFDRWRRRAAASALPGPPGLSPRMRAAAHGLLAALFRRGVRHARLRVRPSEASLTLGEQRRVPLEPEVGARCLASLREAASLAASAPHAAGSFVIDGQAVRLEAYRCHEGDRAFIHLDGDEPPVLRPAFAKLPELSSSALDALHAPALAPEDLLAVRQVSARADAASVLVRHADFTILVEEAAHPRAAPMREALREALCDAVSRGDWRMAWDPATECRAWLRRRPDHPLGDVLTACRRAASPEALSVLGPVLGA